MTKDKFPLIPEESVIASEGAAIPRWMGFNPALSSHNLSRIDTANCKGF
jgi:hypothetical protein